MSEKMCSVLAVETSTKACSAALIHNAQAYSRFEELPQKHAHKILPMVESLLNEANLAAEDIDLLSFGEGPGAFTGIRIASGVIQGLALGLDKPVVPVSSLLAIAESHFQQNDYSTETSMNWVVMLDARMNEVYFMVGHYNVADKRIESEEVLLLSPEIAQSKITALLASSNVSVIGMGDIDNEYPQLIKNFKTWFPALPEALSIARLALQHEHNAKLLSESLPTPVYLRNRVADTIEERKQKQQSKN